MIDRLELVNTFSGETLDLHQDYGAVYILDTADLGVVEANHTSYKYLNQVGVYVTSSTLETRSINITGWIAGHNDAELQAKRQLLNRLINPLHMMELRLRNVFKLNFLPTSSINYSVDYMENNEVACKFLISGMCPDPLFYSVNENTILIAYTIPYFHFPLIIPREGIIMSLREPSLIGEVNNIGDVYTGMRVVFTATGTVVNPSITNLVTQEFIRINKTLVSGEVVEVSTLEGSKYVRGTLQGVTSNYYGYRDLDSSWIQVMPGINSFQYTATEGAEVLEVSIYIYTRNLEVE